jgi:cytochrome c5
LPEGALAPTSIIRRFAPNDRQREDCMTTEKHTPDHEAPHEGPIKTPKQLVVAVVLSFVVPVLLIIMLAKYIASETKPAAGSDRMAASSVAQRIAPVATVAVKDASDPAALAGGDKVYAAQCAACHASGAAGAPKLGDATAWAPRLKTGYDALLQSALKGKGSMPPQGGGDYSDVEIGRAVVHMANQSGGKFDEPKVPAAQAAAGDKAVAPSAAAAPAPAAPAAPAAQVAAVTQAAAPTAAAAPAAGTVPALYTQACQVCHAAGVAGAPKLGDKAAWSPRLALGVDGLTASVVKGKGAMPPKGGSTASDADIKATVAYMVEQVK